MNTYKKKLLKKAFEDITSGKEEVVELGSGVFLESVESLKEQQLEWIKESCEEEEEREFFYDDDREDGREIDFDSYKAWITTDNGYLTGVDSVEELIEELEGCI